MLVSQTKEIIKIILLRVHQHGRHDVRCKPAIGTFSNEDGDANNEGKEQ